MQKEILQYQELDRELRKIKRDLSENENYKEVVRLQEKRKEIDLIVAKLDDKAVELKNAVVNVAKSVQNSLWKLLLKISVHQTFASQRS